MLKIDSYCSHPARLFPHDRGFFAVVKIDSSFAYLADGRSRLLDKPKKKNPKHLRVTNTVIDPMRMETAVLFCL